MAKKSRRLPKGPSPQALKWMEERLQGKHPGLTPTPEHYQSIWKTYYIPERYTPATLQMISEAEARLGIKIPASVRQQLLIQNGGCLADCEVRPFQDASVHWTNATIDGIEPVQSWKRACDDHWFDNAKDVENLSLLIRIAAHSEAQFCLDYRKSGRQGMPGVTFIDVCMAPTEVLTIVETVDEFINTMIASR